MVAGGCIWWLEGVYGDWRLYVESGQVYFCVMYLVSD